MANVKISDLTGAASASGTQEFEVNDSGTSKKVTGTQLATFIEGEVSSSPTLTGQVSLDNGTNTAPSLTNTGDTNTGLYFPSDDTVGLAAGGGLKLSANASGVDVTGTLTSDGLTVDGDVKRNAVSLGSTASPAEEIGLRYQASSGAGNRAGIQFYNTFSNNGSAWMSLMTSDTSNNFRDRILIEGNGDISFYEDTGTTPKFFWDASAESLGIGTSSPTDKLNISSGSNQIGLDTGNQATYGTLDLGHFTNGAFIGTQAGTNAASNLLRFGTSGTEAMRIDSSGNVGIGTSSPSASINKFIQVYQPSTGNAGIKLNAGSTTGFDFIQNQLGESFIYNRDNSYLAFGTNNSERMRIDSNGNLLVGKPSFDATATGSILSNNGELWVTRSNSTPVYIRRLSTDGTLIQFNKDGTAVGSISVTGSSTAYNTSSDYRLKEDVQPMTGASDRVLDLKPVNFAWKADGSRVDGFLAHELQEVVPGAAHGVKDEVDDEGNPVYQGIDQSKLVPLLTAALQEALTEIADLKVRITALEG